MKNKKLNTIEKNIVESIQTDLNEMSKTLKTITSSISKQEGLNESLKNVSNYTSILHSMHSKL